MTNDVSFALVDLGHVGVTYVTNMFSKVVLPKTRDYDLNIPKFKFYSKSSV